MHEGLNINNEALIEVLQNKLALASVREAQLEAAVQQLLAEVASLQEDRSEQSEAP